ncbi:hypothetical protein [Salinigranum marinum]|uniref:hypothetical protein n=1 Tax=Salinigranum marinum TaxID=1515595 RepID=UPI002989EB98|nr:hypothetical protein [Salinigranum marinum]
MSSLSVHDHLRPVDADLPDGAYRVVGTADATVTLLLIVDADGERIHSGEIWTVARGDLDGFERVDRPDGTRPVGRVGVSLLEAAYWSVRAFVQQLAAHPLPSAAAIALVLAGSVGQRAAPLPDLAFGVSILAGSLGLAYVGSGRLS